MSQPGVMELVDALLDMHQRFGCDEISATYELSGLSVSVTLVRGARLSFERDDGSSWSLQVSDLP
ncbi:MAG TPA: hypothetical protein VGI27_01845 [Solirubrobacteraceae bacterium]|jgi:hypothetical protein